MSNPLKRLEHSELKNVRFTPKVFKVVMPWEERTSDARKQDELVKTNTNKLRVAVLPFSNLSPDKSDEYFADGLTEELIDKLCQIRDLEVIARTSVMSYKKKSDLKISDIAKELRVGTLVEGSVRKAGNYIQVFRNPWIRSLH